MMNHRFFARFSLVLLLIGWIAGAPDAQAITLTVAGVSRLPIVIGPAADPQVRNAAEDLATYLQRISGATLEVIVGDGSHGIVLGMMGDFEKLAVDIEFGGGSFERDHYLLRSTDRGLYLLGASPLAVQFAVWDLLNRLGYRYFFPTATWEIIPSNPDLRIEIDEYQQPSYYNRSAPRGGIRMDQRPWARESWPAWQVRNRTASSFHLATGHVYGRVIRANQAEFDANPDYFGLIQGERSPRAQPNVAHPQVQRIFVDYALNTLRRFPELDSVAMDPLDGSPWSECEESLAIGRPSEQAVFLANRVAEAVVGAFGSEKYVGMYGYSHHSPPPEIDVHPNVIVSLATSFIRGGYTFEQMIDGWSQRTHMIGIREYYGLTVWHWSLPGRARASNLAYLRRTIPHFHDRGARFMNAESDDTWGGYGLGYYLAARMLWDVREADHLEALVEDFLEKSFGPAREPMRVFYDLIDGESRDPRVPTRRRPLDDEMVGRMYRTLAEAREMVREDPAARARVDDLILYTRYVDLFRAFEQASGLERQAAFDALMSFAWRIRATMMAESVGLVRSIDRLVRRDENLRWGEGHTRHVPADQHREGADEPFAEAQMQAILAAGIDRHPLLDLSVDRVQSTGELRPANFKPAERGATNRGNSPHRGSLTAYLWTDEGTLPRFSFRAGLIYQDRGNLRIDLFDADGEGVLEAEIPPDGAAHALEVTVPAPGLYRLEITNTHQGYQWDYQPRGSRLTLQAGGDSPLRGNWYDRLYFFVPEGTTEVVLAGELRAGRHAFHDGDGRRIAPEAIQVQQDFITIPVPAGQAGKVWSLRLQSLRPTLRLLNIPPFVAYSPDELLLPEGTVRSR